MSTGNDDLDAWKRQLTVMLAFELADSGRYEDFTDVAYALQFEYGLATAQELIDDADTRRTLNQRCAAACDALAPAPVSEPVAEPPAMRDEHLAAAAEQFAPEPFPEFTETPSFLRRLGLAFGRTDTRTIKTANAAS